VGGQGWLALIEVGSRPAAQPAGSQEVAWFQDQKFGLFLHWGAYSQLGVIESWPLVWADRVGRTRPSAPAGRWRSSGRSTASPQTFNPTAFDPASWAALARRAGIRYVVFNKHHDGFSMYDTRMTGYRVTSPEVPFSRPAREHCGSPFSAFRKEGFGIGAYFSKSDWNTPFYWKPGVFAEDRNPNYDTVTERDRWSKFEFVHGQVRSW
jgi:alpha-L-fucosidase